MNSSAFSLRGIVSVAAQQIALAAVLAVLAIGWLHIPDANPVEVLASLLLGLLIAAVAGAGQSAIALRLTNTPMTVRRLLLGACAIVVAYVIWHVISLGVDHLSLNDGMRAGYLNSRFPASLRNIFSYMHLVMWLEWFWSALRWIAAALLAAAAFACMTCAAPVRGMFAIFRSGRYWMSVVLLAIGGVVIAGALLNWMPGHGLRAELFSLVLRMLTVVVLYAGSIALLLQAMAGAVLRVQTDGIAVPSISHARTVDIP